jgi:hypothetical protein
MYAKDLIGKWAIRTSPTCNGDSSYTTTSVKIVSVSCNGIEIEQFPYGSMGYRGALPASFNDNAWKLANDDRLIKIQIGTCKCFNVSRQMASAICKMLEAV